MPPSQPSETAMATATIIYGKRMPSKAATISILEIAKGIDEDYAPLREACKAVIDSEVEDVWDRVDDLADVLALATPKGEADAT